MKKVLVIGMGPAGVSTSIFLAQRGYTVLVVGKPSKSHFKVGESLSPDAGSLLRQLGVWEEFISAKHLRNHGTQYCWGSDAPKFHDYLNHPMGDGWHIDRRSFESMLIRRARSLGVKLSQNLSVTKIISKPEKHTSPRFKRDSWNIEFQSGKAIESKEFSFIVDATGRNCWLARHQGSERLFEDAQLALVAVLEREGNDPESSMSTIETVGNGWWYSANIPNQKTVAMLVCTPDKQQRKEWQEPNCWWNLISETNTIKKFVDSISHRLLEKPRFVDCSSGIMSPVAGHRWLAVGDAAMCYDPIAAHGLLMSMVSARQAAVSIENFFLDKEDSLGSYSNLLYWSFENYVTERRKIYFTETRFPDSQYWKLHREHFKN